MSQTLVKITPYLGRACSQCGTIVEHDNICPNCRASVRINMDLLGYKNMLTTTFLNVEGRQNRIIQIVREGFASSDSELKKYLSLKTLEVVLAQINEEILIVIEKECSGVMKQFSSFRQQGEQLMEYLQDLSKNLNLQIQKIQKNLQNPVGIAFQEYGTSFSQLTTFQNKLKRLVKKGVKKSLLERFTFDKNRAAQIASSIQNLKNGLSDTIHLQEIFQKFQKYFQQEMENIDVENLQTNEIELLAELECQLLEFQILFKVRDALCKEPMESDWKLFFRKILRYISGVWGVLKIIFAGGGME